MSKSSTIKEVADRAGISIGTVDRVLHNRAGVSAKSKALVLDAIKDLNYEANPHAAILASKKNFNIAIILPQFSDGDYWSKVFKGMESGARKMEFSNISTSVFSYDQYDPMSFRKAAEELVASEPSGVIIPTLFENDSRLLAGRLSRLGIPYMIIDSFFDDPDSLAYYGAPLYRSGQLAAYLMMLRSKPQSVAIMRLIRDKEHLADPTRNRRAGFMDYISTYAPECMVYNVFLKPDDAAYNEEQLDLFFSSHPDVRHLVMFNSRLFLLEKWLSENPDPGRQVLGFASLDANIDMLKKQLASFLICWKPERQSELAVEALADYLLIGRKPEKAINYMHMDILTEMNAVDY